MRTLYLDLGMGAAGDMLSAALLELLPDPDAFTAKLNAVGIPGVAYTREKSVKCGITGTHLTVTVDGAEEGVEHAHHHDHEHAHDHDHDHDHDHEHTHEHIHNHDGEPHEHHHGSVAEITHVVRDHLTIPEAVKERVLEVYAILAEAESKVHGVPVTDIHFHEVGTMDALADITAFCLLMDELAPERVAASPVHVGAGHVKCAHGLLPVPAPATAEILKGIPTYGGGVRGELCTPTGAALLKRFVNEFGDMPVMAVDRIGYGMGRKDFETANCVRAMLGESRAAEQDIIELSCNVDDMTAEEVGFAMEMLFAAGANEVFTAPAGMKKNRPGTLICVLCEKDRKDTIVAAIFRHTTTIGIRENPMKRYVLGRRTETVETPYGEVRRKVSGGFGAEKTKIEYDDVARVAREKGIGLREARKLLGGDV